MNYRSIKDLDHIILKRLDILPKDIDLIVGVPRSGMLPANLLALYLNLPYTDIESFKKGYIYSSGARKQYFNSSDYKKILIVDDSIASGAALRKSKSELSTVSKDFELLFCAIYATKEKNDLVDFYFENVETPRYFQWNIMNHSTLDKACFDIDGVLCVDPSEAENDDGPKYINFIKNAKPLYVPKCKLGAIVTSRLEKYRPETEKWLEEHGIKYDKLYMLDLPDKKARQGLNCHGRHKAEAYAHSKYNLFVESDLSQAIEINRITKKPVFCTENFEMIFNSQSWVYNLKSGRSLPAIRKAALKGRTLWNKVKSLAQQIISPPQLKSN